MILGRALEAVILVGFVAACDAQVSETEPPGPASAGSAAANAGAPVGPPTAGSAVGYRGGGGRGGGRGRGRAFGRRQRGHSG
jgi:hypothetical protein